MPRWRKIVHAFSNWRSVPFYLGYGLVFLVSYYLASTDFGKGVIGEFAKLPALAALTGVLWQVFRDEAAFTRQLELKRQEEYFNLSVASHMANVVFDKHAQFSKEYVDGVNQGIGELLSRGPNKASEIAMHLVEIRRKHEPWVAASVSEKLEMFEKALYDLGIRAEYWETKPSPDSRRKEYDLIHDLWSDIVGLERPPTSPPTSPENQKQARKVIEHLQNVLGITELTNLRVDVVRRATDRLKEV